MKRHSSNDIKQYKKYDKIRWVLTFVAFLLGAVLFVSFGLQIFGHGKQKPSEWFTKSDKQIEQVVDETLDNVATESEAE